MKRRVFVLKKRWLITSLVGLFLIALSGSVFAWSGNADVSGKPDEFTPSGSTGYYIWQDDRGFHIWTTTPNVAHVFTGVIHTDGVIFNIKGHNLERGDSVRTDEDFRRRSWTNGHARGNRLVFGGRELSYEKDQIRFKFDTTGGSDGLNFQLRNARYIDFELFVDGHPVNRKNIHIGQSSWQPLSFKFRLNQ